MSYDKTIVKKPWGYEYLVYQNDKVGLWFLHIAKNQQTSMHCHPNKTTGLILLDGEAELSFLGDSYKLKPVSKTMIRKGLFHSTKALSEKGAFVFFFLSPSLHMVTPFKNLKVAATLAVSDKFLYSASYFSLNIIIS